MINYIKSLIESAETMDSSLKIIDPRQKTDNIEEENFLFKDAYTKASVSIKTDYERAKSVFSEAKSILYMRIPTDVVGKVNVELHTVSLYPNIIPDVAIAIKLFTDEHQISKENDPDTCVEKFRLFIERKISMDILTVKGIPGSIITTDVDLRIINKNLDLLRNNICNLEEELYTSYIFISDKLNNAKECNELEVYARIFNYVTRVLFKILSIYAAIEEELIAVFRAYRHINSKSINESAGNNEENAKQYINEIDKLIDEIREFYDGFKYKELITPRKKKEPKMYEYVLGALNRKYTLKIPIYKVEGATSDVKDIIEKQFISKLELIAKKYPNFCILSPDWYENKDLFIYITLREPFGDKDDRSNRETQTQNESIDMSDEKIKAIKKQIEYNEKQQTANLGAGKPIDDLKAENRKLKETLNKFKSQNESILNKGLKNILNKNKPKKFTEDELKEMGIKTFKPETFEFETFKHDTFEPETFKNEAALTTSQKAELNDWEFGLPETRDYPLNDETRIRKAIQFFGYCKAENKQTLANNIVRRIIELNLVGKVNISEKHPNKKYFPEWMLDNKNPKLKLKGDTYDIYVDGEKVDYGTLEKHEPLNESFIVTNSNGNLL